MLLLAPTEHALHAILRTTDERFKVSSIPEANGCDILVLTKSGIIGFQRKTLPDLFASLQDGRLYYELGQLQCSATVSNAFLVVESRFETTTDGASYTEANISVSTFRSVVAKFAAFGVGYVPTDSTHDTLSACLSISSYLSTGNWKTIHRPKATRNEWGQTTNETYASFLLQSFPGIGPKVAVAIYRHFSCVPLRWTVDATELARVPGVGPKRAEALLAALAPSPAVAGPTAVD